MMIDYGIATNYKEMRKEREEGFTGKERTRNGYREKEEEVGSVRMNGFACFRTAVTDLVDVIIEQDHCIYHVY